MSSPVPEELRALERLASVAQVGGLRPPSTPRSSWLCSVLLGAPGEVWPESEGRPMWPLCQVLVDELPTAAPAPLADVALLTLFMDLVDLPQESRGSGGWELRTYPTADGLVPLVEPDRDPAPGSHEEYISVRPFPVIWRPRVELPSRDDAPMELLDAWDALADGDDRLDLDGFKVGGWPRAIQAEVDWSLGHPGGIADAEFVLQVDSDEKAGLWIGDTGAVYVGWSASEGWLVDWQCC
jgi:Domain of unknown function (DUF1963)